jgi:hypothetical protein
MKKLTVLLLLAGCSYSGLDGIDEYSFYPPSVSSTEIQLQNKAISPLVKDFMTAFAERNDLEAALVIFEESPEIDLIRCLFYTKTKQNLTVLRSQIVQAIQELQLTVNTTAIFRPYLSEFPFPVSKIRMTFMNTINNSDLSDIVTVRWEKGLISYYQCENGVDFTPFFQETYEESLLAQASLVKPEIKEP